MDQYANPTHERNTMQVFRTFVRSDVVVESLKFTSLKPALTQLRKHQGDEGLERLELCVVECSAKTWEREQAAKAKRHAAVVAASK